MSKENDGKTTIVNALNQIILGYDIMGSWIDVQFLQFIYLWDTIHRRKLDSMYQCTNAKCTTYRPLNSANLNGSSSWPESANSMKSSFLSPTQVQQQRTQIMVYRLLARYQPVRPHVGMAAKMLDLRVTTCSNNNKCTALRPTPVFRQCPATTATLYFKTNFVFLRLAIWVMYSHQTTFTVMKSKEQSRLTKAKYWSIFPHPLFSIYTSLTIFHFRRRHGSVDHSSWYSY